VQYWLYGVAAAAGFIVCYSITLVSGRREAWDAGEYFVFGIPLMCVVILVLTWKNPRHPWRWTLSMAAGQAAAMALGGGSATLWPLAVVAMTVVSVPQFVTGAVASRMALRYAARHREGGIR